MALLTNKYYTHAVIILDDYIYCGCHHFHVSALDAFTSAYDPSEELIAEGWAKYTGELTSVEEYETLSKHENVDVRIAVASHPNTPIEVLKVLSGDHYIWVRESVYSNPNFFL